MGNPKHLIILLILCGTIFYSCCQDDIAYKQLGCVTNEDCVSCHHAAEYCNWCEDYNFNLKSTNPSCNVWESLIADGCPEDRILKSKRSYSFVNEDKPLMDMTSSDTNSGNQIRPQKMTITLKPGETRTISFEYRLAKNYPLDLYYLMDLTWSMRDDKITLVGLKDELPIAIKKLTDHFRLGFGSFADKPLMPYTAMDERHRQNPCAFELGACDPTYTFQHSLSLTHKAGDFISVVNETKVTANLDNTEAAMEALVQVIQCKEEIGWADDSRKIVIIATDGLVHFAGLGKLGGVVKPNDEKCYLNNNGFYTQSTVMDFPSLGQIDRILKENKVNVIFAVTEDVKNEYVKLNELLPENTYVGRLEANSSNILSLVKQGYEDFVSVISFSDNSVDPLKITYFSDCGSNGSVLETSKCENVEIGKTYKFYVNISIESCPEHSHRKVKTIEISEAQIGKKALTIDVDLHCECECNAKPDELEYSSNCPTNAKLVCGKCKCLTGWMGPDCSCNMKDAELEVLPDATCVGTEGTGICSGAGDCLCGACLCDRGFTGAHCECRECDRDPSNGLVCGGPTRGRCDCGNCVCAAGLTGATCSCPLSQERCILPGDTTVCSGRGECKCGECQCSSSEGLRYAGKFCETCTNCENSVCRLYEDCARAAALGAPTDGVCADKGALYIPTVLEDYATPPENASLCVFRHTEGNSNCDYPFTYEVQRDWTVRVTVYPRTCIDYIQRAMFGGVAMFLSILLLGILALLCVKGVTVVRDKRAYARFLAERDLHLENLGENQQNPLYRSPVSRFTMPDDYNRAKKD